MRYLEQLIDRARELSQNTSYDATTGVSQRVFTQYFQNAQDFIVREIINSKCKYFLYFDPNYINVVSGQEPYNYPSDIYLQGIDSLEWSDDRKTWLFLEKNITKDRTTSVSGYPYGYYLNRDHYILTPPLQHGFLRITYNRKPKRLEKRSAKVSSVTGSTTITAIALDSAYSSGQNGDESYINQFSNVSVVGKDGTIKIANLPITSCGSNAIVMPSYTLVSGEAIATGDYILADGGSCNVPQYDDMIESFLILHATYQAKYGDSSQWTNATQQDVMAHAKQIVASFGILSEDVNHIPIVNTDFLALW